jgi:hypothetical protein
MNLVSRQAAIGAFTAAALMLGASAGPITQPSAPSYTVLAIGALGSVAVLRERIAVVAGRVLDFVLDDALDAFGEIAARLKQI